MASQPGSIDDIDRRVHQRYEIVQKLGKGAYGIVWRAKDKKTRQTVALKKIFDAFQNATDAQRTYREVIYLQFLEGHENIISLQQVLRADSDRDIYLVFDYMETDLHAAIRANILEPAHERYVMYQAFKALMYIHSAGLVHRDLKPANLLLNAECLMKLADFGLCRSLSELSRVADEGSHLTDYVATRWYRAPEILLASKKYRETVDMWSLGCIFAEMLQGKPMFAGTSTLNQLERVIEKIGFPNDEEQKAIETPFSKTMLDNLRTGPDSARKEWSTLLPKADADATNLLSRLIAWDPEKRLSAEAGITHSYCAQFHDASTEMKWPEERSLPAALLGIKDDTKMSSAAYRNALYDKIRETKEQMRFKS